MTNLNFKTRTLTTCICVTLLCALFVSGATASPRMVPDYGAMQTAYYEDEISGEEYAELVVMGIWERESLADRWLTERTTRGPCLTMIMKEIREIAKSDTKIRIDFDDSRWRPNMDNTIQSPDGLFSIHYNTTGDHAVYQPDVDVDPSDGIPDFVNRCAEAFDYAWHMEVDTLGFDPPSSDYGLGGSDNYDVYMYDNGYWGFTFWEGPAPDYPERPGAKYSHCFINPTFNFSEIHHDSCRIPALQVTSAHELHHGIQFIYDANEMWALMEQTSVWMENVVRDETYCCAAYWVLMHEFLNNPHKWLYFDEVGSRFHYGACMWPFYLEHNFGTDIMR